MTLYKPFGAFAVTCDFFCHFNVYFVQCGKESIVIIVFGALCMYSYLDGKNHDMKRSKKMIEFLCIPHFISDYEYEDELYIRRRIMEQACFCNKILS